MREIKFQYIYELLGTICRPILTLKQIEEGLASADSFPSSAKIIAKRQFTGLQDKNGVDIYEGDIVSVLFTEWASQSRDDERSLDEYMESLEKVFTVCFYNGSFQISGKGYYGNDIGYDNIECGKHGYIKVIGNIHQNPELLKG